MINCCTFSDCAFLKLYKVFLAMSIPCCKVRAKQYKILIKYNSVFLIVLNLKLLFKILNIYTCMRFLNLLKIKNIPFKS